MTTYEEVALACGLDEQKSRRYVVYMRGRSWRAKEATHCQTGYAAEWAERFKMGVEYVASDLEGRALLDAMKDGMA